jgi:translation initiation factor IF-3
VRLIDSGGEQLGIMNLRDAQEIADSRSLDLVEVAGEARPPVVRIMDFYKFRYEQRKKSQESKRKTKSPATAMKEVKVRSRTEAHDVEFKTGHIRRFLEKGHRVKISVFFKGREITRPELGRVMLDKVLESITDIATPEGFPRMEGRNMSVICVPHQNPEKGAKASTASTPPTPAPTPAKKPESETESK